MKWPKSNMMTCIHGLGSSVINYVISDIPIYKQIVKFDLLGDHKLNSHHRPLTLTLNFVMHKSSIKEHYDNQRHLLSEKIESQYLLKDLGHSLNHLTY
jgi:hypothetical protein